jgi:hypothetical protein
MPDAQPLDPSSPAYALIAVLALLVGVLALREVFRVVASYFLKGEEGATPRSAGGRAGPTGESTTDGRHPHPLRPVDEAGHLACRSIDPPV